MRKYNLTAKWNHFKTRPLLLKVAIALIVLSGLLIIVAMFVQPETRLMVNGFVNLCNAAAMTCMAINWKKVGATKRMVHMCLFMATVMYGVAFCFLVLAA